MRNRLFIALLGLFFSSAAAADIVIGVGAPLTGPRAAEGRAIVAAAENAIARINSEGGISGQQIRITAGADGCEPSQASIAAAAIVAEKPALVVGHPCSSAAIAAARVYASANVIFIATGARHPDLTVRRAGKMVFRLAGRDDAQGAAAGAYLAAAYADRPIAIIQDRTAYARRLTAHVMAALQKGGKFGVLQIPIVAGEKDYGAAIAKLKEARTGAVYFAGFPSEAALVLRQMRDAGVEAPFIGCDTLATSEFPEAAGATGEGAQIFAGFDWGASKDQASSKDHASSNAQPRSGVPAGSNGADGASVRTAAAIEIWAAAARIANSTDTALVAAILSHETLPAEVGQLSFDSNGDARIPSFAIHRLSGGKWQHVN